MRKKLIRKGIKAVFMWFCLVTCGFALVIGLVAMTGVQNSYAAKSNQGDKDTMYAKIAYQVFEECLKDPEHFNTSRDDAWTGIPVVKSDTLKGSDWFMTSDSGHAVESGRLLEYKINKDDENGMIFCGENNNILMKTYVDGKQYLNLGGHHEEIVCDGDKGHLFESDSLTDKSKSDGHCKEAYEGKDESFSFPSPTYGSYENDVKVNQEDYLDELVKNVRFGGDIPGGSLYALTDLEKYYLKYETFINVCTDGKEPSDSKSGDYYFEILMPDSDGELKTKYFSLSKDTYKKVNKPSFKLMARGNKSYTCSDLAKTLNNKNSSEVKAYAEYIKEVGVENEKESPATEQSNEGVCYKGAGALGWLLCPIIDGVSKIGDKVWGWIEENFLQIQAGKFFESDGGLEGAWSIFRNIANIVFIILFIMVIFSQLTGVGIDNYGIKKIMPKLIVVAILINLSFLICELLVDLSNILGSGLNQLFSSLASEVKGAEVTGVSIGQSLVMGVFTVGGVAGGILFTILNPVGSIGIAISVLGVMISALISIVFLFFILLVRNAGVIILIAIAPVAIVCYMLPNTEKLFRRWVELLKAVLIVYPICGAIVGAGRLAGRLLAAVGNQTNNDGMIIAAMLIEVLPFFLIPMLLRQSLQLMGNIGARLQNAGQRVGRGASQRATGAIRGSERFKNFQQYQGEMRSGKRAEKLMNKLNRRARGNPIKNLSQRDQHRLFNATNATNSWRQKNAQVGVGAYELSETLAQSRAQSSKHSQELKSYSDQYSTLTRTEMGSELHSAVEAYKGDRSAENATRLEAAIIASESRGMNKEMLKEFGGLRLSANNSQDAGVLNQLASSNDKVISQFGRQMSKPVNAGANLSVDEFAADAGSVRMSDAFAEAGPNVLVGANDDTLEYVKSHGRDAATNDMLVNVASNTSSPKELRQVNDMFATADPDKIKFTGNNLTKFDTSVLTTLASRIKPGSELQKTFIKASDDIKANPEMLANLHPENRKIINAIRSRVKDSSGVPLSPI